jgi:hypothetical protein
LRAVQEVIYIFLNFFNISTSKKLNSITPLIAAAPAKAVFNTNIIDLLVARSRPRGPLTSDKKTRRQALELYYYYTGKKYTASSCFQVSKKRRIPASASNI